MKLLVVNSVCRRMFFTFPFLPSSMSKQYLATSDTNCYSCLLNSSSAFVASRLFVHRVMETLNLHFY